MRNNNYTYLLQCKCGKATIKVGDLALVGCRCHESQMVEAWIRTTKSDVLAAVRNASMVLSLTDEMFAFNQEVNLSVPAEPAEPDHSQCFQHPKGRFISITLCLDTKPDGQYSVNVTARTTNDSAVDVYDTDYTDRLTQVLPIAHAKLAGTFNDLIEAALEISSTWGVSE